MGQALKESGSAVFPADSPLRPGLTVIHPRKGLIAVGSETSTGDGMAVLNRAVAELRHDFPALGRTTVVRRLIDARATRSDGWTLTQDDAAATTWVDDLPDAPLDASHEALLLDALAPAFTFDTPRRDRLEDAGAAERAALRLTLDARQAEAASAAVEDILVIDGPPGSGKTLVLLARARWLASQHPDWVIQILCYNRLLVPYLAQRVADHPGIIVSTFGRFAHAHGFRVDLGDEDQARKDVARAMPRARPAVDALLIDEWQDFFPSWTELGLALLRPGGGGAVMAGDPHQALYRDSTMADGLAGRSVARIELGHPYRSTRQILEAGVAMDPSMKMQGLDSAPDGEPVDLIWAHSAFEQARSIARDVSLLLASGERTPDQIGVLYMRRWQVRGIAAALGERDIPFRMIFAKEAEALDLAEPTVKIITTHSAKGYEFDVVFLAGLEHLRPPGGSPEDTRQGRAAFVGATRARDQLLITYSKDNAYLERIRTLPTETLRRWVWPDDYPEL